MATGPVRALLIGAGNRGRATYGAWALEHPEQLRLVGVAEPHEERRNRFAKEHGLGAPAVFADWAALLAARPRADAVIVATPDTCHEEPALAAIEAGYELLLEKPIAPDPEACVRIVLAAERAGRLLQIAHPLRFTPFYRKVREIVGSGVLGRIHTFDLREHVAHWHMTHSYVRGKFRKRAIAAPLILAKACHDLDLLGWLSEARALRVASFGRLSLYRPERAPTGAPERCTDGCPVQDECPHDAVRFYLGAAPGREAHWPYSDVSADPSPAARRRALETGPYGRCVFRADNDVVDHQLLQVELSSGALACFTVHGHATRERRTLRLSGSQGELRGVLQEGALELSRHGQREREQIALDVAPGGHFGGDEGLVGHFVELASARRAGSPLRDREVALSGRTALDAHLLGFAAERARLEGRVVELPPVVPNGKR